MLGAQAVAHPEAVLADLCYVCHSWLLLLKIQPFRIFIDNSSALKVCSLQSSIFKPVSTAEDMKNKSSLIQAPLQL